MVSLLLRHPVRWLTVLAVAACSPVHLLNATIPLGGLTVTRDIAYGPAARERLDIYRPATAAGPLPVVVFVYGGSWQFGARREYRFVAATLARQGLVVVVPDYRLYPTVRFPDFLADCAQAVIWTDHNIAGFGGDQKKLFLMGHSAGAYNVAMLALDPHYLAAAGGDRATIAGVIGLAGPYDFLPIEDPDIKPIFAVPDEAATQPINFADGHNPPMLLLAGTDDTIVYPKNTASLAAHIHAAGGIVEDKFYPGVGHIGLVLSFAPLFRGKAPALADTMDFIHRIDSQPPTTARSAP